MTVSTRAAFASDPVRALERCRMSLVVNRGRPVRGRAGTLMRIKKPPCRWPKPGDLPFRKVAGAETSGRLSRDGFMRGIRMLDGFMRAGTLLADQAKDQPELIYPALYCYRHGIELWLKWLIAMYRRSAGVRPENPRDAHDLWSLWTDFRSVHKAYGVEADDKGLMAVEQVIKQFHDWDKKGEVFRYPANRNGKVGRHQYLDIDLANLGDVMAGLVNFFNGIDEWLDAIASA